MSKFHLSFVFLLFLILFSQNCTNSTAKKPTYDKEPPTDNYPSLCYDHHTYKCQYNDKTQNVQSVANLDVSPNYFCKERGVGHHFIYQSSTTRPCGELLCRWQCTNSRCSINFSLPNGETPNNGSVIVCENQNNLPSGTTVRYCSIKKGNCYYGT